MMIPVNADDTKTLAAIVGDVLALQIAVDGISDSEIVGSSINLTTGFSTAIKTTPATTAENERTGLFNFSQTGTPYKFGLDVPSIAEATITNGKIDLSNSSILAFKAAILTAGAALTVVSTAIHSLVALLDALITFRKHRKAESRRSFEVAP